MANPKVNPIIMQTLQNPQMRQAMAKSRDQKATKFDGHPFLCLLVRVYPLSYLSGSVQLKH
jgi:hypothetical protein